MATVNNDNGNANQEEAGVGQIFEVEQILNMKIRKKRKEYLVRWLGYGSEDDTWEDEESLDCPDVLEAFLKKRRKHQSLRTGTKEPSKEEKKHRHDSDSKLTVHSRPADSEASIASSNTSKLLKAAISNASSLNDGEKQSTDSNSADQRSRSNSQSSSASSSAREVSKNSTSAATLEPFEKNPQSEGNQLEKTNDNQAPAPSTVAKISDILDQNQIVKTEVLSELTGGFSSSNNGNIEADVAITPVATALQPSSRKRNQSKPTTLSPAIKASKTDDGTSRGRSLNMGNVVSNNDLVGSLSSQNGNMDQASDIPAPESHQCFGNSPTISDFAEGVIVRNVNNQKMEYVFSTQWKVQCEECSNNQVISDDTVDYAFSIVTYNNNNYFLIKLKNPGKELFLVDAEKFRKTCEHRYLIYFDIVKKYLEALGTLEGAIEQQRILVKKATNTKYFQVCKANVEKLDVTGDFCEEAHNTFKEIVNLFFSELRLAIGKFMYKEIDCSSLHAFAMEFYEKRNQIFNIIKKEDVENKYEALYNTLVSKLAFD